MQSKEWHRMKHGMEQNQGWSTWEIWLWILCSYSQGRTTNVWLKSQKVNTIGIWKENKRIPIEWSSPAEGSSQVWCPFQRRRKQVEVNSESTPRDDISETHRIALELPCEPEIHTTDLPIDKATVPALRRSTRERHPPDYYRSTSSWFTENLRPMKRQSFLLTAWNGPKRWNLRWDHWMIMTFVIFSITKWKESHWQQMGIQDQKRHWRKCWTTQSETSRTGIHPTVQSWLWQNL